MPIREPIPLASVESETIAPERVVEQQWNDEMERNGGYSEREVAKLRSDIRELQMPGEICIQESTHKSQEYEPISPDERRGGFSYESHRTSKYLVVGAKKKENTHGLYSEYVGGERFLITSYESGIHGRSHLEPKTAEEYRQELLAEKRERLHNDIRRLFYEQKDRSKEWLEKYATARESFIGALETQWKQEDDHILTERFGDYHAYEAIAERVRSARTLVEHVQEEIKRCRLTLSSDVAYGEIGKDSLEDLEKCEKALLAFVAEAKVRIAQYLEDFDAVVFATSEERDRAMEAEPTPAPWFLYGVEPTLLEKFGRKPGEGFGKRVIGKPLVFLPGTKPVVGFHIDGRGSRYGREIFYTGLISLQCGTVQDLPNKGYKDAQDILALVQNPDWAIRWKDTKNGELESYGLANAKGIAKLWSGYEIKEGRIQTEGWDGSPGADISIEDICRAHGLPAYVPLAAQRDSTPVASIASTPPSVPTAPSQPLLGKEALTLAFAQVNLPKGERNIVSAKPSVAGQEYVQEQNIQPTEAQEILLHAHDDLVLIHAIFRGIPVKPYDVPQTKQEGEALATAAATVKEKRAELFMTLTGIRELIESAQIHTVKDRDSMFGKIAALKKSAERLANSKEALLLIGKSVSKDWFSSWMELWKGLPATVRSEVDGMVDEKNIPVILREVQKQVALLMSDFQQGKDLDIKAKIGDAAIPYLE